MTIDVQYEMRKLIDETISNIDSETVWDLSESSQVWEDYDKDNFKEVMGDVEPTKENIFSYYEKRPYELEAIYDTILEEEEFRNWNVNAWRNS